MPPPKPLRYLLGERLGFDWKVVTITVVSTLLLTVDHYQKLTRREYYDHLILFLLIPMLIVLFAFRDNPKNYGFKFGDWKLGLSMTILGILFLAPIIYYLGRFEPAMKEYYDHQSRGLPWTTFLDLLGWEFFFRGFILFGYARIFGVHAIWLQAVPFALAHLGKPAVETYSTIFGGFGFGWVAWRTKSFVWPFLIHWFIASFVIWVAAGKVG